MTAEQKAGLRAYASGLPNGTVMQVSIVREDLLVLLNGEPAAAGISPTTPEARLLTAEEVSERLAVDVQTVRRRQRQLGAVRIGRSVRFTERGVERYLARRTLA